MAFVDSFWAAIPSMGALKNEADVELRLVIPLLESLGYDRNVDIAPKYPVVFQQGRVGRKPEADFVCFYGPLRDRDNSLLVVEAKAPHEGLSDGNHYCKLSRMIECHSFGASTHYRLLLRRR